ncbi:MAG: hypothetical protein JXA30_07400 [Deltaproteobacteria bacterium]|nr:hypothetical protein [Deltaproteobacteria bacterium]
MLLTHKYRIAFFSLFLVFATFSLSNAALAQDDEDSEEREQDSDDKLSADFKGIIGLGLIGAELGFVLPAVAGLDEWWAFVIFPIVGAAGGGVAGYFLLEEGEGHPEAAVATLVIGMALVVPATVLTLSSTAYDPEDESNGASEAASKAHRRARGQRIQQLARAAGPGFVRLSDKGVFLAAPAITPIVPVLSSREDGRQAHNSRAGLRFSLVSGCF